MSDAGKFLSRWSRRKREAAEVIDETKSPAASAQAVENARGAHAAPSDRPAAPKDAAERPEPTFDLASLPAIELITADTDIRAFLAPGVPPELTRAALRRVWAADPKIRDFVGLADYDWDFNTPGSMTGFGLLEMTEELRQVVARIIGPSPTAERMGSLDLAPADVTPGENSSDINPGGRTPPTEQHDSAGIVQDATMQTPGQSHGQDEPTQRNQEDIAAQYKPGQPETLPSIVRHSHGRALPK